MEHEFDVFGIGSPLIDIFIETDDKHLIELELKKGQMHLIDHVKFEKLKNNLKKEPIKTSVAGDVVNTMMGVAAMGGRAVFLGKVGKDKYAPIFEEILLSDNIKPLLSKCDKYYTGQVISFVTSDAERTMTVHLGAAVGLKKEEAAFDDIKKSKFLYTSAYVLDSPDLKETVLHAFEIAKNNNVKIAFDLADPGAVNRHKDLIKSILNDYVDIIFANEKEAEEFTGKMPNEAVNDLSKLCNIAIVKIGENGSLIQKGNTLTHHKIKKEIAIDTTGAGDLYAAGFLFALTKTNDLELCAKVASFSSGKIVQQFGAKLTKPIKNEVEQMIEGKSESF